MDLPSRVEHLKEDIESAFHRCLEFKEFKRLPFEAEQTANGLHVYIAASHNGIQGMQNKTNTRDVDLQKAQEEAVEASIATECETTQLTGIG